MSELHDSSVKTAGKEKSRTGINGGTKSRTGINVDRTARFLDPGPPNLQKVVKSCYSQVEVIPTFSTSLNPRFLQKVINPASSSLEK